MGDVDEFDIRGIKCIVAAVSYAEAVMVEFDIHSLFIALGIAVAALTMYFFKSKFTSSPALRLPSVKEWASAQLGWRERIASLPSILRWTAFALFLLAYADPHSFRDVAPVM